ncbi:unnamed protein product [Arabis nemorensis]|uniref:Auxin-responsive protein n=1 Tax=Arabis nemorensis TaxID=586526 RepID=A0A565ARY0_9BRAS|nr:unnamed protein product [Arabis nemorensis]
MDSDPPGVFPSSFKYHPYYSQTMECGGLIDLGLSLGNIQHESYHASGQSLGGYGEVTDGSQSSCSNFLLSHETGNGKCGKEEYWSNEGCRRKWGYVKVTMDGFVIGHKVCVLDHGGYSTLAHQLEDMFGMQSVSGLRLFETESEFSLVYRDKEGTWRNAGDVPWK